MGNTLGSAVGNPLGSAVGNPLGSAVGKPLGSAVGKPLGSDVGKPLGTRWETRSGAPSGSRTLRAQGRLFHRRRRSVPLTPHSLPPVRHPWALVALQDP